ncbi:hypothetical protein [Bifidobacterium aquikefiricola]|uniref:Glycosyltransferase n=1 Tax=Bifidobacterium aquikefiricola TaxID=3059038 RepID=A0AB39U6E1_9BIFI
MQSDEPLNFRAHNTQSVHGTGIRAGDGFGKLLARGKDGWVGRRSTPVHVALLVLVFCMLELFVFNLAHWTSMSNRPVAHATVSMGSGMRLNDDGSYTITDSGKSTIKLSGIDAHVSNIAIPVHRVFSYANIDGANLPVPRNSTVESRADSSLRVQIEVDDNAHTVPMMLPERTISPYIQSTQRIAVYLAGKTHTVTIHVVNPAGTRFILTANPELNVRVPISVNPLRAILYILVIIVVACLPAFRRLWKEQQFSDRQRRIIWMATGLVSVGISTAVCLSTLPWIYFRMTQWQADFEYQSVARALLAGHAWIDHPVANFLSSMANPYQQNLRYDLQQSSHENFLYDFVFYHGKYYSYFGVLPVIAFFLPYLAITGSDLSPWKVMIVLGIVLSLLAVYLVHLIFERFGKGVPLATQIVVSLAFMTAVQPTYYLLYLPTTYSIPIAGGLALAMGAVIFWLLALRVRSRSRVRCVVYLIIGGVMCGLIVGCRPQLCVVAALLPLLVATERHLRGNGGMRPARYETVSVTTIAACAAVIAGFPFLVWNKIRFGSLFDFGASYQLTVTDQREQVSGLTKIPYALWQAFVTPPQVTDRFPFIQSVTHESTSAGGYQGFFYSEPALGGILWWFPLSLILFLLFIKGVRSRLRKGAVVLVGTVAVLGVVPIVVDVAASAYTARYLCDCALLIGLATTMAIAFIHEGSVGVYKRYFTRLCVVLAIGALILNVWSLFMGGRLYGMSDANPILYAAAMNMFAVF